MNEYEFHLVYALPDGQEDPEAHLDALFEAGCDDALIGTGVEGRLALAFTRDAQSAEDALRTAKNNVEAAIPGAKLVEVKPDLVGATEIAELSQCTRQNVQKQLAKIKSKLIPSYSMSTVQLYHLAKIRTFLKEYTSLSIPDAAFDISEVALRENINLLRD